MENGDALYARIAELEKENGMMKEKYNDLWDYGRDDYCEVNIVNMLLKEGNKKRVMEVWSDVYEFHRSTGLIDFEEDDEDEEEKEEVLKDLTCKKLRARLKGYGKGGYSRAKKPELIKMVEEHEKMTKKFLESAD